MHAHNDIEIVDQRIVAEHQQMAIEVIAVIAVQHRLRVSCNA